MFVYNISNKVEAAIEADWVLWQQEEHIPAIMASGQFTDYKFYKLLDDENDDSATYIIQYFAPANENYHNYLSNFAPQRRQEAFEKWGNRFTAFRSLMQEVT
jgi:uncharacterized protein DUF4286